MMNEKQAVKFWNSISGGEVIGFVPDSQHSQGFPIEKPTYTSTICDQFELGSLIVPRIQYSHDCLNKSTANPSSDDCRNVASFLRMLADKIEGAAVVKYD